MKLKHGMTKHPLALASIFFLAIYDKLVCPFMDSLGIGQLFLGLGIVTAAQLIIREVLFNIWKFPANKWSLPRFAFYISITAWLFTGIIAIIVHTILYPDFHISSHIKLLTGYWAIGAGLMAQFEYAFFERKLCTKYQQSTTGYSQHNEQLSRRILESFSLFTLVPAISVSLLAWRLTYEGYISSAVAVEIVFLSLFFVIIASLIAWYWGETLKEHTEHIVNGLEKIS